MVAKNPPPEKVVHDSSFTTGNYTFTQEHYIQGLQRFAQQLNRRITSRDVENADRTTVANPSTLADHFGTFNGALKAANLPIYQERWNREKAAQRLRALAKELSRIPTSRDVAKASKEGKCPCVLTLTRLFGSFNKTLYAAGLFYAPEQRRIIRGLRALAKILRRTPTARDTTAASRNMVPSVTTIQNHFNGKYNNALRAARLPIVREIKARLSTHPTIPYKGICADCHKDRLLVMRVNKIQGACRRCYKERRDRSKEKSAA